MSENKVNTSRLRALGRKSFILKILRELISNKYLWQQKQSRKSAILIFVSMTSTFFTHTQKFVSNRWQGYILIGGSHTPQYFWKSGVHQTHLYVGKVCLPVNGEVADKSGRKYASGDRNAKSLDLGPEPTDWLVTTSNRTTYGTRPANRTRKM